MAHFLQRLWGRFGHHSTEHLNTLVRGQRVYSAALEAGEGHEIPFDAIARFFEAQRQVKSGTTVRSEDGREWKKWTPRATK